MNEKNPPITMAEIYCNLIDCNYTDWPEIEHLYFLCKKYAIALQEVLCISTGKAIPELMKAQEIARKALGL